MSAPSGVKGCWEPVLPDLLRWRDSCNVYAVLGEEAALIVDAGTGAWLESVGDLPVPPAAVLLTHYLRDHAAGAAPAARAGIPVYVPAGEQAICADPWEHFRHRSVDIIYDNVWDLFAPAEPIAVAGVLRDYERLTLAGIELRVLPLPGATPTQVGLVLHTPRSGRLVAFCGETIHSPGRVPRIAPLQHDYLDAMGAVGVAYSVRELRALQPDLLLPSLGEPIAQEPDAALAALHENLHAYCWNREQERLAIELIDDDRVERVSDSVWRSTQGFAGSTFVIGRSGHALAIDYGYWLPLGESAPYGGGLMPSYALPERRRPLLHSLAPLREQLGVERLDAVIPTHYHDDHVAGIPLLQRLHGTPCWAPATFARLLADPAGHRFPCNWHEPIAVERTLGFDEPLEWDGIRFHFEPMSGHTRFSALIGWEVDGVRYVHLGDQAVPRQPDRPPREWTQPAFWPNYSYRNGAFLDSYRHSAEWIARFRPDVVFSGHSVPTVTDAAYFEQLAELGREYEERHRRLVALDDADAHFGLDAMAGWIWPYRVHMAAPGPVELEVTVRNPLPDAAELSLRLAGPDGWEGSTATLRAAARAEVTTRMTIAPDGPCRRVPVTVELHADGRPFGQILEALVTVGGAAW